MLYYYTKGVIRKEFVVNNSNGMIWRHLMFCTIVNTLLIYSNDPERRTYNNNWTDKTVQIYWKIYFWTHEILIKNGITDKCKKCIKIKSIKG